jgi:ornithine--oxo-acid transaminase
MAADRQIELIGAAWGIGGADTGCAEAPEALARAGLEALLRERGAQVMSGRSVALPPAGRDTAGTVGRVSLELADAVAQTLGAGRVPCVIGGDHSCAIGTWSGAARALSAHGALGLLWIDAHMDSHTPGTTVSGRLHGMPLAFLLGHGDERLQGIEAGALDPRHVCLVGVRSFEPEEAKLLERLGVRVFFMDEIWQRGLPAVFRDALEIVGRDTAGYGVTLDLDAVDPGDAPGVATPVPGGLRAPMLLEALAGLARDPRLIGFELVEYTPRRDRDGQAARVALELLSAALTGRYAPTWSASATEALYAASNYAPMPVVLARGEGAWLWDDRGRRYLDMMSAYSATSMGHAHPRLVAALAAQARQLGVTSRMYHNERLPRLLERLCRLTGMERALPANSGAEAVEAAIKVARKWAYEVKAVPEDRAEIIACEGNFHGRTIAIVGLSTEPQYREGFGPFPGGLRTIPYGDAQALERAIGPHTAAFLVEPVQGERGIIVPPAGYLAACARLCAKHNVLFIADEVQTGLGRTGRLLACQHEDVKPDGLILGKALGGGLLPVSAFLAREDVLGVLRPGDHGSTFGGNPLAAAVALEALEVLVEERLAERAAKLGEWLLGELRSLSSPLVREVRGQGLLIGVELDTRRVQARALAMRLLEHGVLTCETHGSVIRFAPALVVTRAQLEWGLERIRAAFAEADKDLKQAA